MRVREFPLLPPPLPLPPNNTKPEKSSGLFVVDRSEELHQQLLAHYKHYDPKWYNMIHSPNNKVHSVNDPNRSWADQSLMNDFFKDRWHKLSYTHNLQKRVFLHRPDLWNPNEIKIIHYTGGWFVYRLTLSLVH